MTAYLECRYNQSNDQWSWVSESCSDSSASGHEIFNPDLQACTQEVLCEQSDSRGVAWRGRPGEWVRKSCFGYSSPPDKGKTGTVEGNIINNNNNNMARRNCRCSKSCLSATQKDLRLLLLLMERTQAFFVGTTLSAPSATRGYCCHRNAPTPTLPNCHPWITRR